MLLRASIVSWTSSVRDALQAAYRGERQRQARQPARQIDSILQGIDNDEDLEAGKRRVAI